MKRYLLFSGIHPDRLRPNHGGWRHFVRSSDNLHKLVVDCQTKINEELIDWAHIVDTATEKVVKNFDREIN